MTTQSVTLATVLCTEQNDLYVAEQLLMVNFKCFICNKKCSTDAKNNHPPKFGQLTDLVLGI